MHYNRFEIWGANLLSKFPLLKKIVKFLYVYTYSIIYKNKHKSFSFYPINKIEFQNEETFFGYYDKSPESPDGKYLIFHSSPNPTYYSPKKLDFVNIIVLKNNELYHKIRTSAFNWQIGSRLQWLDNNSFIYNDFSKLENKYISKIFFLDSLDSIELNHPIYDTNNYKGITIDFELLDYMKSDYGYYRVQRRNTKPQGSVYLINLKSYFYDKLFDLKDVINCEYSKIFNNASHKINHIMMSPNSEKFIFIHRYFYHGIKKERLLLYDLMKNKLNVIIDSGFISHMCWLDETNLIGYFKSIEGNIGYHIIDIETKNTQKLFPGSELNSVDGHPSVNKGKLIFDTYPDKARNQSLFIHDIINNETKLIGSFFEPIKYRNITRCDLHPRWNTRGDKIFFDSTHSGYRAMYFINLNDEV